LTEEMLMDCSISLHLACVLGRTRLVKQLLAECPAIINAMDSVNKLTAVHVAAKHGHDEVLALLLSLNPKLVATNSNENRTPLHFAAENGHAKIVEQLLAHSPDLLDAQDSNRKTGLQLAIEHGHDLVVAQFMRYNPTFELETLVHDDDDDDDDDDERWEEKSAVYLALERGHEKIVALLLANPNAFLGKDKLKRTPLHLAVTKGLDSSVALLLAHEPSIVDIRDCRGEIALHRAVKVGHADIVAQLLAHSPATVHVVNNHQKSVLHFAAKRGFVEISALLLAHNAAIDAVDQCKSSALHKAVFRGHTDLVELLLAHKALVTDDFDDDDPLIFRPVVRGHNKIVAMLLAHSPQLLDARRKGDGRNALHFASDPEMAQQLLSLDPSLLEEKTVMGSALLAAVINSRDQVVAQMLAQCPGADVCQGSVPFSAFKLSNEQTLEVLLAHKPELIHERVDNECLLRCALDRQFSREFVTKVWELDKRAMRVVKDYETPFHVALRKNIKWAIDMMQWQLSLDEIMEACKRTQTPHDRFRPSMIEQLSVDLMEVVCEYLGFEPRKRAGKRARDDEA